MARVLSIGDVHEPVSHPGYIHFCRDIYREWGCDTVVFAGDITDWHAVSFHAKHPDCPGPNDEYELAREKIAIWYRAFPEAKVCLGNHDERVIRLAQVAGIPSRMLRDHAEVWGTPNWQWVDDTIIDDVLYFHGTGQGGIHPAFNAMKKYLMSVVMGHCHAAAGIKWLANSRRRIFGMDVGTGIDVRAMQFAYGKHSIAKPILGAGLILDGIPYHEICPIGDGERYDRRRFKQTPRRR